MHNLHIEKNGQAAMMFCGDPPWHGLGTLLNQPATAAEAIKAARLDWDVVKVPLHVKAGDAYREIPHRFAVMRNDKAGDPGAPVLGIVGSEYVPLQNREAFA